MLVTYVYGDELGESSGAGPAYAARSTGYHGGPHDRDLPVYVVEVCQGCSWNHIITSYVVGTGERQPVRRARRRAAEE